MKAQRKVEARDDAVIGQDLDRYILDLTASLFRGPAETVPGLSDEWLARLADLVDVDRIMVWELSAQRAVVLRRYLHTRPESSSLPPDAMPAVQFAWLMQQNQRGQLVAWRRLPEDIPPEAVAERQYAEEIGAKSLLSIPVFSHSALCSLAFTSVQRFQNWSQPIIDRLALISTLFVGAMVRQRLDASLRASEERFRGAFEGSAIGMSIIGPDGRWLRSNAANCRILGYSEAELRTMTFQSLTHPDDVSLNREQYQRALQGEIDCYELKKRYIHKDGHIVHGLLTVSVVRDERGTPLYFVSQIQDQTESIKERSEIERLRGELAHSGRLALMGQLTASLAHQLMQPISAVHANAEACQRLLAGHRPSLADARRALQDIVASCTRATYIVENVKGLLRKQAGTRHLVSVNALLNEVLEVMRHDLAARRIKLVTMFDHASPRIVANPIELQQVFLNLLVNAAEALEQQAAHREIRIGTRHREPHVEVFVQDSGPGVPPVDLKRIFEPFFTTKSEGMGMGLAICRDIVVAHAGQISVAADPASGFRVCCSFPSV